MYDISHIDNIFSIACCMQSYGHELKAM